MICDFVLFSITKPNKKKKKNVEAKEYRRKCGIIRHRIDANSKRYCIAYCSDV